MEGGGAGLGLTTANHVRVIFGQFAVKWLLVEVYGHGETTFPSAL